MKNARPHVVILDENLPVPLDRRVWLEAGALKAAGYDVTIISPRGGDGMTARREVRDGIQILRYPQRAASGLSGYLLEYAPSIALTAVWLLWLAKRRRIDYIHGCNPPDLFFLFGLAGRPMGVSYIYDQHDANPELCEAKWGDRPIGRLLRGLTGLLERASYRTAGLVIVPNDSYAQLARQRGKVRPNRLVVVPNAPPAGHLRQLAAGSTPPDDGVFRIGYLGVMGSQDGIETLVEAAAVVRRIRPTLRFEVNLVGNGEARPRLERLAAERGVSDVMRFHGYLQADRFVPLLASSNVCVSPDPPTPFNNGCTMTKVVEYLAIGRPVVAFDLQETRRLVGDAGLIVEDATAAALASGLVRLAEEPGLLDAFSLSASTRFDHLGISWERSARQLVDGYSRLKTS